MDNEFGYIDDKPFNKCYTNKQVMAVITTDDDGIVFKVTGDISYDVFDSEEAPQKIYAVDRKLCPITAFRTYITSSTLTAISSTTFKSDLYFYKQGFQEKNEKIKHFTDKTKIYKIEYYNDSISRAFGNNSFMISKKYKRNKMKNAKITLKEIEEEKIGNINIDDNNIAIFLKYDFHYLHSYKNCENISITDNSHIILKFKKGIIFNDAYKYILLLDTIFYLMTLLKRRHKKIYVYDFRQNKYYCRDMKVEKEGREVTDRNFLICKRQEVISNFIKMFEELYILENESKNALFPFWEFDVKQTSLEIKFLEYYKTLEYLDYEKRKKLGKGKNKTFLKEILTNNKELRENFFGNQDITEIEEEIRALRNYYSHEGYYLEELPIPTERPRRYKEVTSEWLYNVLDFMKLASFIAIYKVCEINVEWNRLRYNIK